MVKKRNDQNAPIGTYDTNKEVDFVSRRKVIDKAKMSTGIALESSKHGSGIDQNVLEGRPTRIGQEKERGMAAW
ncbi:hypothetical protein GOBAR_AA21134 [Gossypium barbadense]|uniref:Uncharacterized protein n=1 Tax=Gossypium barbadense TaxID=3634 RepID=A0A2P5X867_GOSBA|nr:hypothetical protein GOBAR_AA21134 [Gossypium barbadense]